MTRNEAVKILASQWATCTDAVGLVTAMESLGLLKFEELTAREKFKNELISLRVYEDNAAFLRAMTAFDRSQA